MRKRVCVAVEVEAPQDWTEHDLMDVIRFHLMLSDLSDVETDISAVKILNARPIREATDADQ